MKFYLKINRYVVSLDEKSKTECWMWMVLNNGERTEGVLNNVIIHGYEEISQIECEDVLGQI